MLRLLYIFLALVIVSCGADDNGNAPLDDSTPPVITLIGHYTQMIWDSTKEVGIAYSVSKSGKVYVVARYYPTGNRVGEHPY